MATASGKASWWRASTAPSAGTLQPLHTLEPGDLIITGTPQGVELGTKPPRFLKAGDVVSLGIAGLGQQTQRIVSRSAVATAR